jgi:hypothetical protein
MTSNPARFVLQAATDRLAGTAPAWAGGGLVSKDEFMAAIQAWRERHPNREEAYLSVIPKHVADSMALEGDTVDIEFLREQLANL